MFRFAGFELDEATGELRRGDAVVDVQPKALALLRYLVLHRDRAVPHDEIFAALWPEEVVTASSLTSCLHKLRHALGVDGRGLIRTVRRHGLRFVGTCETTVGGGAPAAGPRGATPVAPADARFVGRRAELDGLRQSFATALSGNGGAVILRGGEGIGKSTLVDAFRDVVLASGAGFVDAAGFEGEGVPPLWPWARVVRGVLAMPRRNRDQPLPVGTRSALADLIPELADACVRADTDRDSESTARRRFLAFDAVCRVLQSAGEQDGLVVVVEDLQWADDVSVALFRFAAEQLRRSRVLLLVTLRTDAVIADPSLAEEIRRVDEVRSIRHIDVPPLSADESAELILRTVPRAIAPESLERLYALTGGIPLFVEHAALDLATQALRGHPGGHDGGPFDPIPEASREIVVRSLARLDPTARQVLSTAAVLGDEFGVDALARLLRASDDLPAATARRRVAESVAAGRGSYILVRASESDSDARFAHGLLRQVLYAELEPARRSRLHWLAGLEAERALRHGHGEIATVAGHFVHGASVGDPMRAIDACLQAAAQARSVTGYVRAAALLWRADEIAVHAAEIPLERHAEILTALTESLGAAGRAEAARGVASRAVAAARSTGRGDLIARALLGDSSPFLPPGEYVPERVSRIEEALSLRPPLPDETRVRLLARLALESFYRDPSGESRRDASDRAVELARGMKRPQVLFDALLSRFDVLTAPDTFERRRATVREMLGLAASCGDRERQSLALAHAALLAGQAGSFSEAEGCMAESERIGRLTQSPTSRVRVAVWRSVMAALRGDWREFEVQIASARHVAEFIDSELAAQIGRSAAPMLMIHGSLTAATVQDDARRFPDRSEYAIGLIHAYVEAGETERARAALAGHFAKGMADLPWDGRWLPMGIWLALACARLAERERCEEAYESLAPYADRHALFTNRGIVGYIGTAHWALAELAAVLRRFSAAEAHVDAATAACRELGALPFLAHARLAQATMLAARGRKGDRALRDEALGEAKELAEALGMPALLRRIATFPR